MTFHQNGKIAEGCFREVGFKVGVVTVVSDDKPIDLGFDQNGLIRIINFHHDYVQQLEVGASGWLYLKGSIHVSQLGSIFKAQLSKPQKVKTIKGDLVLDAEMIVFFNEQGIATEWFIPN